MTHQKGVTPITLQLEPGPIEIELTKENYETTKVTREVLAGVLNEFTVPLKREAPRPPQIKYGRLTVNTLPAGDNAQLRVGNQTIDSGQNVQVVAGNPINVTCTKSGISETITLTISENESKELTCHLELNYVLYAVDVLNSSRINSATFQIDNKGVERSFSLICR